MARKKSLAVPPPASAPASVAAGNGVWNRLKGKTVRFEGTKYNVNERPRLQLLAREHGATLASAITPKVNFVVVPDTSVLPKAIKGRVVALNARGAAIQLLDADDFARLVAPTEAEVADIIRRGPGGMKLHNAGVDAWSPSARLKPVRQISGQSFAGLDLSGYDFEQTAFDECDFSRTRLARARFVVATRCNFDKAGGDDARFGDVTGSTFRGAALHDMDVYEQCGDIDFTGAQVNAVSFNQYGWGRKKGKMPGLVFRKASLKRATFSEDCHLVAPDFESADASGANWYGCPMESPNFRNANLSGANLSSTKLRNADFTGANLRDAALVDADLAGARFDGADLTGCNLRGGKIAGADFSRARGYQPPAKAPTTAGPALQELDKAISKAKRIKFSFKLDRAVAGAREDWSNRDEISADSSGLSYGAGVTIPIYVPSARSRGSRRTKMSHELLAAARAVGEVKIRFETLEVQTTRSKLKANALREVLERALCEAFAQEPPEAGKLSSAAKEHRAAARLVKQKEAAQNRKQRAKWAKQAQAARERQAQMLEQKVAKAVGGKVSDIASFLKALEVRADKSKIDKATKMLKAERFQLFNDITDSHLAGVVKSQTDPDLVYACRIESDGRFACCTQNLNICGGLRGSACKHLLVLIIGLVKAGRLDPAAIDGWVAKTRQQKPELDKEKMGEIFVRYKGAEAGEIDWRPTETVPEDYYAL